MKYSKWSFSWLGFSISIVRGKINLNTATAEEIAKLDGIDLRLANLIVNGRETALYKGLFDLQQRISLIGDDIREGIANEVVF